jgi:hypothetical protein
MEVTSVLIGNAELGSVAQRARWGSTSGGDAEGGWGGACGAFLPRIRLPPQATSLGLCEPPLGSSLFSRAARPKDFVMSLRETKHSRKRETEQRRTLTQWKQIRSDEWMKIRDMEMNRE